MENLPKLRIFTIGIALLLGACGDASEPVDAFGGSSSGATTGDADESGESGSDDGGSSTSGETEGSTGETEGSTGETEGSTGETEGSTGETEGEDMSPGPGDPCDPITAPPCEDPQNPEIELTCTTVPHQGDNETVWEWECMPTKDTQGNGTDLGDGCDDDGGAWANEGSAAGCLNLGCLGNGLGNNPDLDEHANWPTNECPFEQDGTFVKGCCTLYCNADNPCDAGWTCVSLTQTLNIETDVGICVWNG
jgi:hypothetical protein